VGRLLVAEKGTLGQNVWYVRIEDANGATVMEQAFPAGAISLDRRLPQGDYRVLSWSRGCSGTCPASGEKGLRPLGDVCGAVVRISTGQTTRLEMAIKPDASCAISETA